MGSRVEVHKRGAGANDRTSTKAARRAAYRATLAKQAATRRRNKLLLWYGLAAVAVIAVAGVIVAGVTSSPAKSESTKSSTSTSATAAASTNPALATKPKVGAGTGDVTSLGVTTLIQGEGAAVTSGQTISVNYVGVSFKTGKEFDSSWSRSQPFEFTIGQGKVITGWDQGLLGVKVGSRVQLDIPSAMAYGDNASGGAPSGPLRFVVDVLSAK